MPKSATQRTLRITESHREIGRSLPVVYYSPFPVIPHYSPWLFSAFSVLNSEKRAQSRMRPAGRSRTGSMIRRYFRSRDLLDREVHGVWLERKNLAFLSFQVHQDAIFADDVFTDEPIRVQFVKDRKRPGPGVGLRV